MGSSSNSGSDETNNEHVIKHDLKHEIKEVILIILLCAAIVVLMYISYSCGRNSKIKEIEQSISTESSVESDLSGQSESSDSDTSDIGQLKLVSDSVEFSNENTKFIITESENYTISMISDSNTEDIIVTDKAVQQALDIVRICALGAISNSNQSLEDEIVDTVENEVFAYVSDIESGKIYDLSDDDMGKAYDYYDSISSKDLIDIDENGTLSAGEQLLALVKFKYAPSWEKQLEK